MARRTEDVVYGLAGQTALYRVPQGRPTSATFKVFADSMGDDDDPEFSGSATVDSVNTTVSSSSGASQADPRKVSVSSTVGILAGRKYLLTENQLQEWGEVLSVHTGYVRMRDRLMNDFTTAATFQSTYLSAAIDAAWVAEESNLSDLSDPNPDYRIRWLIVLSGLEHLAYSFFDLVRAQRVVHVDLGDVTRRWPGLGEMINQTDRAEQARGMIADTWRMVRADLAGIDLNDTAVMEDEVLDELTILAARVLIAEGGIHPRAFSATDFVKLATDRYERFLEQHFKGRLRAPIAAGSDSGAERREPASIWEK